MDVKMTYKKGAKYYLYTPAMFFKSFYIHKEDFKEFKTDPKKMIAEYSVLTDKAIKKMNEQYNTMW